MVFPGPGSGIGEHGDIGQGGSIVSRPAQPVCGEIPRNLTGCRETLKSTSRTGRVSPITVCTSAALDLLDLTLSVAVWSTQLFLSQSV